MKRTLHSERGSVLITSVMVIAFTAIVVAAGLALTQGVARSSNRSVVRAAAIQMGLGAIDTAFASWREIARNNVSSSPTTQDLNSIKKAVMADFGSEPGYAISNITVSAVTPQLGPLSPGVPPTPSFGPSDSTTSYYYLATADVTAPCLGGQVTTKIRRIFEKQVLSPWNYAIFYDNDLEIHPGPSQVITGWVHTNGTLYTAHDTLTFGSKATSVKGWSIAFKPGDGKHPGETPVSPSYQADIPPAKDVNHQPFGIDPWAVFAPRYADGSNEGWLELIKRPVPGKTDPLATARYYNQADVRILIDTNNAVTIKDKNNNNLTSGSFYTTFRNAVTTSSTGISDFRESSTTGAVRLVTLDVSQITSAVNAGTVTFNGIVYIADTSASSTARRGVKIKNAASIPSAGLSIVSENPVYVQGNVNTGSGNPPSNTVPDPTQPEVSGYTRRPMLIAGDAINILSNAWSDSNSSADVTSSSRQATNTTINAALLGGIVPTATSANNYSGGAENFPRFLEDWGGAYFTYYGSMVCLYDSAQATGTWGKGNVYGAPTRRWYFDTRLRQSPPPGNLATVNFLRDRWWTE